MNTQSLLNPNYKFSIREESPFWYEPRNPQQIEVGETSRIVAYTDGSLKDNVMGSASVYYTISDDHIETEFAVRQSKPTPVQPSSTKPEVEAILDCIQNIPKTNELEVRSDSANALNNIKTIISSTVQDRQLLKMNNHATLTSIKYEYDQFQTKPTFTKVKAHTNIQGNERADEEANSARNLAHFTLPNLHQTIRDSTSNTFLHEAGTLIEKYPGHFIKLKNREQTEKNLQDKLVKYYHKLFPNKEGTIDWDTTKKIVSCVLHKQNYLDTSHTFEQKFRINLITNQLPLNGKLFEQNITETNKCNHCDEIETQFHLFQCQNTVKKQDELAKSTYSLMQSRLPKALQKKKLALEEIMIPRENFFIPNKTPKILFGYFCTETQNALMSKSKSFDLGLSQHAVKILHTTFIDCWLTSFYKIIWLPRAESCKKMINKTRREKLKQKSKNRQQARQQRDNNTFQEEIPPEPPPMQPALPSTPENTLTNNMKRREYFTPIAIIKRPNNNHTPRNKKRYLEQSPTSTVKSIMYPRDPKDFKHKKSKLSTAVSNNRKICKDHPEKSIFNPASPSSNPQSVNNQDENPFLVSSSSKRSSRDQRNSTIKPTNKFYGRF